MPPLDPSRANPAGGPVPFGQEDLVRSFDAKSIQRARHLIMLGAVDLAESEAQIEATVAESGTRYEAIVMPMRLGARVLFDRRCSCGRSGCPHVAAAALAALETRPEWRRQGTLFDRLDKVHAAPRLAPATEPAAPPRATSFADGAPRVAVWTIEPGSDNAAMYVTAHLARIGRDGRPESGAVPATLSQVMAHVTRTVQGDADRAVARLLLGSGNLIRTPISKDRRHLVDAALKRLLAGGRLRWRDGRVLTEAPRRVIRAVKDAKSGKLRPLDLPEGGVLIRGESWWCADPKAGRIGPAELRAVAPPPAKAMPRAASKAVSGARTPPVPASHPSSATADIVDRTPRVILRLGRVASEDAGLIDVAHLVFDYGDPGRAAEIDADDQRQFARIATASGDVFARRDKRLEQRMSERLAAAGFSQFRVASAGTGGGEKGQRFHALRGRDAAERWAAFLQTEVPALEAEGVEIVRGADFGVTLVEPQSEVALAVSDAGEGWFDLEIGVEIDGVKRSLVPILVRLIEAGGMEAARIVDGKVHAVLEDGRALALPAERVAQLMSVLEAMLDRGRTIDGKLCAPLEEADALVDIDGIVERKGEASRIESYLARLREEEAPLEEHPEPASFRGELRHYQRQGLAWLQRLRANRLSGCLGDDMGLGKTAQTIGHLALEHEAGRLDAPALIVVPTSLVPNWTAELARFAPHLKCVVMHGLERHQRWDEVATAQLVITTYAILARDVEALKAQRWSLVVLDEAQAIKNPDAKATRAACSLEAGQRLCLSGTPIENNLGEVWSQFAFLMPGLLGDRKSFQKRYRTPIEKRGDGVRAGQLARRLKPFLLRRTKAEVAADLPPKTEVVRRIELNPAQRDLYEAIRVSAHERVREAIAASGLAKSQITVLDALLKLRQACCDPRLVKLDAARAVAESTKLAALVEMLEEMVPEGSRILVFSQFTSMLDLIKPELDKAEIAYLELTGDTRDRETPVRLFQAGAVPVFLLSLKAGGRGLNLTAADTVIHYDPWWNPAAEAQATDRAHRIGQDKPVFVYKLIASGTVEEKIIDLQRRKAGLADAVVGAGELAGALTDEDVNYLFAAEEG